MHLLQLLTAIIIRLQHEYRALSRAAAGVSGCEMPTAPVVPLREGRGDGNEGGAARGSAQPPGAAVDVGEVEPLMKLEQVAGVQVEHG